MTQTYEIFFNNQKFHKTFLNVCFFADLQQNSASQGVKIFRTKLPAITTSSGARGKADSEKA